MIDFGLSTWDSRCPIVHMDDTLDYDNIINSVRTDENCNYRNLVVNSTFYKEINKEFTKVIGKESAIFNLNIATMMSDYCMKRIKKLNYMSTNSEEFKWQPKIYLVAQCVEDNFINPLTGSVSITRKSILILTALTDLAIVCAFMVTVIFIEKISWKALQEFKDFDNSFETRDFAVQVTNLPPAKEYKNE